MKQRLKETRQVDSYSCREHRKGRRKKRSERKSRRDEDDKGNTSAMKGAKK